MKREGFVSYKNMERGGRKMKMDMWVMLTCPKCGCWFIFNNKTEDINYSEGDDFTLIPNSEISSCECGKEA
jgi:hypothetical protein